MLCPWANTFLCLVLVQPRKMGKPPDMTEKVLTLVNTNKQTIFV